MDEAKLKAILSSLPDRPGVYIFRDAAGEVLYVGKAKSLKKRVSSYFRRRDSFLSPRLRKLVELIEEVHVVRTSTEAEALVLESQLIKRYQPFFNVDLKMGERYPYVCIAEGDPFPRILIARGGERVGMRCFGPYTKVSDVRNILRFVERFLPLRTCSTPMEEGKPSRERPCLRHFVGKCKAPCCGRISSAEYGRMVEQLTLLLEGRFGELFSALREAMEEAAKDLRFEEAARFRDALKALASLHRQRISSPLREGIDDQTWMEMEELRKALDMRGLPWRIEGVDISHTGRSQAVGSVVVFDNGLPNKSLYRRYKIRESEAPNDPAMIYEVIKRRYERVLSGYEPPSDLLLVDGGPAQLGAALKALFQLGLRDKQVVALAKEEELLYVPRRSSPLRLPDDSLALRLLKRVRDEAHRFAHAYQDALRRKALTTSKLLEIPGVGKKRLSLLLSTFGSVEAIKNATEEEIARVPGIGPGLARTIKQNLP